MTRHPRPPTLLRPHPPRVPLGGRRRLHRPRPLDRPARRDGFFASQAVAADGVTKFRQPAGPEAAALRRQGQERHLPVHVRRPEPRRHVRLQARAVRARRQDDPGQDLRPRRAQERGPRRRAEVEVQAVRPVRQVGQRPVPAPGHVRRRHRLPPLDDRRLADPRLGHAADEHGQDPLAAARASARGSTTAWAARTRTCPASSSCSTRPAGRSAAPRTGRAATCRPPTRASILRSAGDADPRPRTARRA